MIKVPLRNSDKVAIVDDGWEEDVLSQKWYLTSGGYVRTGSGSVPIILLHQLILGVEPGYFIDHINRDPLDNRTANLRHVTKAQSQWNKGLLRNNSSGCPGVGYVKDARTCGRKHWRVIIRVNGQRKFFGYYQTFEEAQAVWKIKVKELHGKYVGWLNSSS